MNQWQWEDAAGSCSLAAKYCYFIGKYGQIPAAHSGGEVNEHNSRKEQLQIWKKKGNAAWKHMGRNKTW